jgi:two-component system, LytTR family, response regulator
VTIRAVIVDDERLARKKIQTFAAAHDDLEIVAECSNGATAVEAIGALHPDVVFLDVRMPRMDGFAVLRQLPRNAIPRVVFVTAHGEHAIEAFEVEAIDYLLKPFDRHRFDQTLDRIRRERRMHEDTDLRRRLVDLLDRLEPAAVDPRLTQFVVTAKGKTVFVDPADVHWIGAEGKYVRLHTANGTHLLRESIGEIERRLDAHQFLRIHRSTIVNVRNVKEMYRGVGDDYVVELHDGKRLSLSRRYRARFKNFVA